MRLGARRAAFPLGFLVIVLVALGLSGSVSAQRGSAFEGLPAEIQTGTSATFDFRYVPAVDGLFSQKLTLELEGASVGSGQGPSEVLVGGAAGVTVEIVSTAANLYEIRMTVAPDFLTRLGDRGLLTNGQYVLAFFVATSTGAEMFDFRTPADAPELITITAGAPVPGAPPPPTTTPPAPAPATPPPGGDPGLPAAGSGGLADVASAGQRLVWLVAVMTFVALLALGGTTLVGKGRPSRRS